MAISEKFSLTNITLQEIKEGKALPSFFRSHSINKHFSHDLLSAMFSHFCAFVVISLLKVTLK